MGRSGPCACQQLMWLCARGGPSAPGATWRSPPRAPPLSAAGYGITTAGLPAIDDMEQFLKDQLDSRLANGRSPMQISLFYEWCALGGISMQGPNAASLHVMCMRLSKFL